MRFPAGAKRRGQHRRTIGADRRTLRAGRPGWLLALMDISVQLLVSNSW